jgi:hypothetical protein
MHWKTKLALGSCGAARPIVGVTPPLNQIDKNSVEQLRLVWMRGMGRRVL